MFVLHFKYGKIWPGPMNGTMAVVFALSDSHTHTHTHTGLTRAHTHTHTHTQAYEHPTKRVPGYVISTMRNLPASWTHGLIIEPLTTVNLIHAVIIFYIDSPLVGA